MFVEVQKQILEISRASSGLTLELRESDRDWMEMQRVPLRRGGGRVPMKITPRVGN